MADKRFPHLKMSADEALRRLVRLLQDAHAGEKAAALAYEGHAASVPEPERSEILKIRDEELHHRERLGQMLLKLGAGPRKSRELMMSVIGHGISLFCRIGGWFIPMYGAGRLESGNIAEYEVAARLCLLAGKTEWVEELIEFAELEWDHELYFRQKTESHGLSRWIPLWRPVGQKVRMRAELGEYQAKLSLSQSEILKQALL